MFRYNILIIVILVQYITSVCLLEYTVTGIPTEILKKMFKLWCNGSGSNCGLGIKAFGVVNTNSWV